jgi:hypothetical protein
MESIVGKTDAPLFCAPVETHKDNTTAKTHKAFIINDLSFILTLSLP